MSQDEWRRYQKIGKAISGMRCDLAVALLMTMVGDAIAFSGHSELWDGVLKGVHGKQTGTFEQLVPGVSTRTQ